MKYYLNVLRNYANFSGRARRSEYWYFVLFNIVFTIVAGAIDMALGIGFGGSFMGPVYLLYSLFVVIPAIAVAVRRLHDVGKSGWFIFISLIPLIGGIWLLVLMLTDSNPGSNAYGPNPKETAPENTAATANA